MSTFLIFGRPRSRTAWCANFLTHADSFCFHEGLAESSGSLIHLRTRLHALPSSACGNADTGLIHCPNEALRLFPDARLVVLTGAALSWNVFAQKRNLPQALRDKIDRAYRRTKVMLKGRALFIDVHELMKDHIVAARLWHHCTGRMASFDEERWNMLRDLNIQVIPESLAARLPVR